MKKAIKYLYYILLIIVALLVYYSYSRTAMIIALISIFFYFILVRIRMRYLVANVSRPISVLNVKPIGYLFLIVALLTVFIFLILGSQDLLSFEEDSLYGLSNAARFGSQSAAFLIGFENPIFGVGLGQFGFFAPTHYPNFSFISSEIGIWMDSSPGTAWPPAHSIYARLFAELGGLGLVLWIYFIFRLLSASAYAIKSATDKFQIHFWSAHFASTLSVVLGGGSSDSFRFFGLWILAAMAIAHQRKLSKSKNS